MLALMVNLNDPRPGGRQLVFKIANDVFQTPAVEKGLVNIQSADRLLGKR